MLERINFHCLVSMLVVIRSPVQWLDLIVSGLDRSAAGNTLGQDLNLSLDRVLASRNFANKLWNAGKFIDFNLAQVDKIF